MDVVLNNSSKLASKVKKHISSAYIIVCVGRPAGGDIPISINSDHITSVKTNSSVFAWVLQSVLSAVAQEGYELQSAPVAGQGEYIFSKDAKSTSKKGIAVMSVMQAPEFQAVVYLSAPPDMLAKWRSTVWTFNNSSPDSVIGLQAIPSDKLHEVFSRWVSSSGWVPFAVPVVCNQQSGNQHAPNGTYVLIEPSKISMSTESTLETQCSALDSNPTKELHRHMLQGSHKSPISHEATSKPTEELRSQSASAMPTTTQLRSATGSGLTTSERARIPVLQESGRCLASNPPVACDSSKTLAADEQQISELKPSTSDSSFTFVDDPDGIPSDEDEQYSQTHVCETWSLDLLDDEYGECLEGQMSMGFLEDDLDGPCLCVTKGENVTLLGGDPAWARVRKESGSVGYIPWSCLGLTIIRVREYWPGTRLNLNAQFKKSLKELSWLEDALDVPCLNVTEGENVMLLGGLGIWSLVRKQSGSVGYIHSSCLGLSIHRDRGVHRCFLPDTGFKHRDGSLQLVQNLRLGSRVVLCNGSEAMVASSPRRHERQKQHLVELITNQARLKVSADHRSIKVTPDGTGTETCLARDLKRGDVVIVGSCRRELTKVILSTESTELYEVAFIPDGPIEAYSIPTYGILTRGSSLCAQHGIGIQILDMLGTYTEDDLKAAMPATYED